MHPIIEIRDFYYNNFLDIFEEDEHVPIHVLIEPWVNAIRIN